MPLAAGKLRHRVKVQKVVNTQDATTGEMVPAWTSIYTGVPCSIEPLSVRAFMESRSEQSDFRVRVVMRKLTGLNESQRLVGECGCHYGKIYNPAGWLEDPKSGREYVTAPCSEGVNEG